VKDALFGDLEYEFGWVGQCEWLFLGVAARTRLIIPCEEGAEVSAVQREAYSAFEQRKAEMTNAAENATFAYYRENLPNLRTRFGPQFADQWAPEIASAIDLSHLVRPSEVIIQESVGNPPERVVGLLFDCTWEPSLGLAVKFVDERLNGVGTQDIVL
jgi:hypothetical protein